MAWGGGLYTVENKILPGVYFKFESDPGVTNVFTDRGIVALADRSGWGPVGEVITITQEDWINDSKKYFGYAYTDDAMRPMRELFFGAQKVLFYRLNGGKSASSVQATAKYPGTRGNALAVEVVANGEAFDVVTTLDGAMVDRQTVKTVDALKSNDYLTFTLQELSVTERTALSGGTDEKTPEGAAQEALKAFESYRFDVLCCPSDDSAVQLLYKAWTKRMIEDVGLYHQLVVYRDMKADDPYVISVYNGVLDEGAPAYALAYYVAGVEASCAVNKDLTAHDYMGEYEIDTKGLGHDELVRLRQSGQFVFHRADDVLTVLEDINTYRTWTIERGEDFSFNQCMRVLNQRANDVQKIFISRYLGKAGTDANARMLFKNDLVNNIEKGLQAVGAVMEYSSDDTIVEAGYQPRSFHVRERLRPNLAVTHLYHDITLAREGE